MNRHLIAMLAVAALVPGTALADQQIENAYPPQEPCDVVSVKLDAFVDVERATIANPGNARKLIAAFFQAMSQPPAPKTHPKCLFPSDSTASIQPPQRTLRSAQAQCAAMSADPQHVDIDADDFYAVVQVVKWSDQKPATGGTNANQEPPGLQPSQTGTVPPPSQSAVGKPDSGQAPVSSPAAASPFAPNAATPPANVSVQAPSSGSLDLQGSSGTQTVDKQNWYVYHSGQWSQDDFTTRKHIPGARRIWLIYAHLNRKSIYKVSYPFEITEAVPTPLQDLFALGQLAVTGRAQKLEELNPQVWGGACVPIDYVPSTLTVKPTATPSIPNATATALGDSVTFDDEGPYHYDFSAGVPIHKISELDFSTSGTTVTAKTVDKQNIFALFDYYFAPVDFKRQTFSRIPFLVAGVAITSKPLDRPLIGIGWGTKLVSIYAGVVFNKEQSPRTLAVGNTATPGQLNADLKSHRKGQFAFGLHLSAKAVSDLLKKKS